jgi:hypothetical protein
MLFAHSLYPKTISMCEGGGTDGGVDDKKF